jgi:cyclic beta-1,2-glucan synthetase
VDCPAHLYSHGRYSVLLTAAGTGYSEWEGLLVTRWRADATLDSLGTHIYLRDVETGRAWSAGYQPTAARPERYEAVFLEDRARIVRADGGLATALEVVVSPEDAAELRRLSLTNHGSRAVEVEATSCAELALAPARADAAHPAFAKLFVETEYVAGCGALLAHRRAGPGGPEMWAAHLLAGGGEAAQFETDRARFVGRGRTLRAPLAVEGGGPLGCSAGPVLDPMFSLRARLKVAPGATAHATFVTLAGPTRAAALALAEKYRGAGLFERASALAWTQAQVQLRHLGTGPDEARLFQALAARLLYPASEGRPGQKAAKLAAPALWRLGLSGEKPLALLRVASAEDRPLVEQLLRAHEYWRSKRLEADLVVLCEEGASYAGELWNLVEGLLRARRSARPGQGGGVLALRADLVGEDERALLRAAARVSLTGGRGTLAEQVAGLERAWVAGPVGNGAGPASRALAD